MSYSHNPRNADDKIAIKVEGLGKTYRSYQTPQDRLKQIFWPGKKEFFKEFKALNDFSFTIGRGETVGIIGRNGSGKSTLLQMIAGTLTPSHGDVEINGRIAALLELGAGFNPEYSGRENVFMNGALLGMSNIEVKDKLDDISRFADIGHFIDEPVKTYSSGMYVRLAFSVAIHSEPDILIVDEALSVGDEAYQRKCFAKIESIQASGGTIIFVSHSAGQILQLCSRAILLDGGEKMLEGAPKFVVNNYQRLVNLPHKEALVAREIIRVLSEDDQQNIEPSDTTVSEGNPVDSESLEKFDPNLISQSSVIYETQGAKISKIRITGKAGKPVNILEFGGSYSYRYEVTFDRTVNRVGCGMLIKSVTGIELAGGTTALTPDLLIPIVYKGETVEVEFQFKCLLTPGTYLVNAGASGEQNGERSFLHRILDAIIFQVLDDKKQVITGFLDILEAPPAARIKRLGDL